MMVFHRIFMQLRAAMEIEINEIIELEHSSLKQRSSFGEKETYRMLATFEMIKVQSSVENFDIFE